MTLENLEDNLRAIGNKCGKISEDIMKLHGYLDEVLFVVPLRGGLPIWKGVSYGLHKLNRNKNDYCHEANVMYLPASSIVEQRDEFIQESVLSLLKKEYHEKNYKTIIVIDEALSGSCSKMVLDNVKRGVKGYSEDRNWQRFYWKKLPVELYLLAGKDGRMLNPRIQKLSNVFYYPIKDKIITTDNRKIYPIDYINEVRKEVSSRDGNTYRVVKPDVFLKPNALWGKVVYGIEKGVDEYFEKQEELEEGNKN